MNSTVSRNIKVWLLHVGITQTEVANQVGVTVSSVSDVISGRRSNSRIRQAIADAIGKPVTEIWPDIENNTCQEAAQC